MLGRAQKKFEKKKKSPRASKIQRACVSVVAQRNTHTHTQEDWCVCLVVEEVDLLFGLLLSFHSHNHRCVVQSLLSSWLTKDTHTPN